MHAFHVISLRKCSRRHCLNACFKFRFNLYLTFESNVEPTSNIIFYYFDLSATVVRRLNQRRAIVALNVQLNCLIDFDTTIARRLNRSLGLAPT